MREVKKSYLIFVVLFSCFQLFSVERGEQDYIPVGHWVYESFRRLELESKNLTFVDFAPISIQEFKTYLNEIDYEKLSVPGKKEYDRIIEYLGEKNWSLNSGVFSIGVEPAVNLEFYVTSDCTKDQDDAIPWVYDYTKRQPLVDVPLRLQIADFVTMYMGLQAKQSRCALEMPQTFFNDVFSQERFDLALTHDTYLSAGHLWEDSGVGLNFRLAIMSQSFGQTLMPSAVLSEYLTDTTNINLRFYAPIFGYDFNITQFTRDSYLYTHRVEMRLWKLLEVSLIEGVFAYNTFDLRLMNPFAIFHGLGLFKMYDDDLKINSLLAVKFNLNPVQNLRIYGLYAQNEHQLECEFEKDPGSEKVPEGFAGQLGFEYNIPLAEGYLHFGTEGYYASSFFHLKDTPNLSFAKVYTESLNNYSATYYEWMGNPNGSDCAAFRVNVGYDEVSKWGIELIYDFAAKGELSGNKILKDSKWDYYSNKAEGPWPYDDKADDRNMRSYIAPSGTVEYNNIITVKGTWYPAKWVSVTVQPSYLFINNFNHVPEDNRQGFQLALSTKIALTKIPKHDLKEIDILNRPGN